jgi:defect-in-organelle-trafficking protein DotB
MQQDKIKAASSSRRVSKGVERSRPAEVNIETHEAYMMESEPSRISVEDFRAMLMSAVYTGASDITVQSDMQPRAEIHGVMYRITRKPWSPSEVDMVLMEVYGGSNARTEINGMKVIDCSYELNLPDGARQRFRVNAIGIYGRDGKGVEITLRALPSKTPSLEMVKISDRELEALRPKDGIIVIAGATGSGKTTTMAAITGSQLKDTSNPVKIIDIQAPIENTFMDITGAVKGSSSLIGQSEVGKHIPNFAEGVRAALRRKPKIINVGEARDFETIHASLEASLTGHLVYTTTHAGNVSDAIRRLLSVFPAAEREARAFDLVSALRFMMVQHLVPRIDKPSVIPVREYLRFTPRIKEKLVSSQISEWPMMLIDEVHGRVSDTGPDDMRQSFLEVVKPLYEQGAISRNDAFLLGSSEAVSGTNGEV